MARKKPDPKLKPWHKLPNETTRAYHKFIAYLKLGPDRTIRATAAALGELGSSVNRYRDKYAWRERAAAYDTFHASQDLATHESARATITKRLLEHAHKYVDTIEEIAYGVCDLGHVDDRGAPVVKPSVRLQAAKAGLELAGFVPPRRADPVDLDKVKEGAKLALQGMSIEEIRRVLNALDKD